MIDYRIVTAIIGGIIAALVIYLVRRDHLYIRQALFWLIFAGTTLLFGFMPQLVNALGKTFGISYPPVLLLLVAVLVLFLKNLLGDIALTRMERKLRRLVQQMAIHDGTTPDKH